MTQDQWEMMWAGLIAGFVAGNAFCFFVLHLPSRKLSEEYQERLRQQLKEKL